MYVEAKESYRYKQEEAIMYLELKNVSFSYGDAPVLTNISCGICRGEITGLVGANGAGKTTTIYNVVKKVQPQKGEITIDGENIRSLAGNKFPVTYVPESPLYYEELTVIEHLHFVKALYPKSETSIEALVEKLNLREHFNKVPGMLSKGTLQKLMIAISLLRQYEILIADEPFNGLDPKQISIFKGILNEIRQQNKAILISTHLLDMAENICDKYIFLHGGKVLAAGTKEELIKKYGLPGNSSLETIYLSLIQ